jgi:hypothetical protein
MIEWSLIDWRLVGFSALWITGLSLMLAALSMADYAAAQAGSRVWSKLTEPGYQVALKTGLTLLCSGLAGNTSTVWELLLWLALAGVFAYQAWQALRFLRSSRSHAG